MSRFVDFNLTKRTDELMKPSEKALQAEFNSVTNQKLLHKSVLTRIDPRASYRSVMENMATVFRTSISKNSLPTVDEMNGAVMTLMSRSHQSEKEHQERFVQRIYEHKNVPQSFLPRPSMSIDRNETDRFSTDPRGKHTIEFTR